MKSSPAKIITLSPKMLVCTTHTINLEVFLWGREEKKRTKSFLKKKKSTHECLEVRSLSMTLLQDQKHHSFSVPSDHTDQSRRGCIISHSGRTPLCEWEIRSHTESSRLNTDYLRRRAALPALQRLVLNSGTGIQSSTYGSYISPQLRSSEWPFDPPTT